MDIRRFEISDEADVIALWRECDLIRPWNDPHKEITRKMASQPDWFLVGTLDGKIVASVMAGYDGHRGWLNYVAVARKYRRRGLGGLIIAHAEQLLHAAGCPKINLQVRTANQDVIRFYEKLGYAADDVTSMGKRFSD